MPEQPQIQAGAPQVTTAPDNPVLAAPGQSPAETINTLRGLLDILEATAARPDPIPAAPPEPVSPVQVGTDPLPVQPVEVVVAAAESRLRSSRLWTTIGGSIALASGQFAGLPPITQVCITALVGIYIITRTMQGGR